jgi:hypothetical protein
VFHLTFDAQLTIAYVMNETESQMNAPKSRRLYYGMGGPSELDGVAVDVVFVGLAVVVVMVGAAVIAGFAVMPEPALEFELPCTE